MPKYKSVKVFLNANAKKKLKQRQKVITFILIFLSLILLLASKLLHFPPRYVTYMESDPIQQPFAQMYALVTFAPWSMSQRKINNQEATKLAKRLGYRYWLILSYQDDVLFSLDLLDNWPIEQQILISDFATRPILEQEKHNGLMGLYYFFNDMDPLVFDYLEANYSIKESQASMTLMKEFQPERVPAIAQYQEMDGIINLVVWDSALSPHQKRAPYSTLLRVAEYFSEQRGYDGFILLNYRYIREYQLDFDFFPIRRSMMKESLQALWDLGYEYYPGDILFFR